MLTDANRKVSIIAYFLSEYNEDALRALGYSTYTDAFRCLSALFGKTNNYMKLRRDEFDALNGSPRQGFNKRPPKPEVQILYDGLKGFRFDEMLEIVKELIADTEMPVSISHLTTADKQALAAFSEDDYERILNTADPTAEIERKPGIVNRRIFNREIPQSLKALYRYRCQICGATATIMYGVDVSEAHHIKPFTKSMDNSPRNIAVLCPDHHRIVHKAKAVFDREKCQFIYETANADSLMLNLHL